jgi:hypothetical protein
MICRSQAQRCYRNSPGVSKRLQSSNLSQPLSVRQSEGVRSYTWQRGRRFRCPQSSLCRSSSVPRSTRLSFRSQQLSHSPGPAVSTRLRIASQATLSTMFPGGNNIFCQFPDCKLRTRMPHGYHNKPYQGVTEGQFLGGDHIFIEPDNYGLDVHEVGDYTDPHFAMQTLRQDTSSSGGTSSSSSSSSYATSSGSTYSRPSDGYQNTPYGLDPVDHYEDLANNTVNLPISQSFADCMNGTPTDATYVYICPHCPKTFVGPSARRNWPRHWRRHCPGRQQNMFERVRCGCGEYFSRIDSLKRHQKNTCGKKKDGCTYIGCTDDLLL